MAELTHKQLECPRCRTRVFVRESSIYPPLWRLTHHTAFVNDNGTGYSEQKFSALCPLPGCRLKITKGNLAVAKFARDLTEPEDGSEHYMALSGIHFSAIPIADETPVEVYFSIMESGILDGRRKSRIRLYVHRSSAARAFGLPFSVLLEWTGRKRSRKISATPGRY